MSSETSTVCFEQPLNERTRTLLRLESLFAQVRHHRQDGSPWGRRATLTGILDILVLLSRSDLRTELLKELGDRHTTLSRLQNRPGVDHARLGQILDELQQLGDRLQQVPGQAAATLLKENEFLAGILNRSAIPGGSCGFDVPGYHRWLNLPAEAQQRDLESWCQDMPPFEDAILLLVRLIRESAVPTSRTAEGGIYVHTLEGPCHLIRVLLPAGTRLYPEISAGKHRFTIRFMEHGNVNQRPAQIHGDVPFQLVLCTL